MNKMQEANFPSSQFFATFPQIRSTCKVLICTNSSWSPKLSSRVSLPTGQAVSAWAGERGSVRRKASFLEMLEQGSCVLCHCVLLLVSKSVGWDVCSPGTWYGLWAQHTKNTINKMFFYSQHSQHNGISEVLGKEEMRALFSFQKVPSRGCSPPPYMHLHSKTH